MRVYVFANGTQPSTFLSHVESDLARQPGYALISRGRMIIDGQRAEEMLTRIDNAAGHPIDHLDVAFRIRGRFVALVAEMNPAAYTTQRRTVNAFTTFSMSPARSVYGAFFLPSA